MKLDRESLILHCWIFVLLALVTLLPVSTPLVRAQDTVAPPETSAENESALQLIDQAMQTKLNATRLKDLDKVVELCERAIAEGLDEENARFAQANDRQHVVRAGVTID